MVNAKDIHKYYTKEKEGKLKYKEFKAILDDLITVIVDGMFDNKLWTISSTMGYIHLTKVKRDFTALRLNYKATKDKKQQLIDEGRLPFEEIKDEDGNVIGNNGGEDYRVFFTEDTYYKFKWNRDQVYAEKSYISKASLLYNFNAMRAVKRREKPKDII